MMEYRKLPKGSERIGVLGVGTGGLHAASPDEIERTICAALDAGVNFFDLCAGGSRVYEPFGRAIAGRREQVFFQLHFGAVYTKSGEYGWSRNLDEIRHTFAWEMSCLNTDYVDFGFLHCVDEENDFEEIKKKGILGYVLSLREKGIVRHIGFSSHTPSVANRILDSVPVDLMMFSINPAYDMEQGDDLGIGTAGERAALFRRCEAMGVGISVMKPFHGGQLLDAATSPFGCALTREQCIRYCLDRPAVLTVVPGVRNLQDWHALSHYLTASREELDYSAIGRFTPRSAEGHCVYCNHCQPCPAGIDIGLVNKYYDLALAGDDMAADHYTKLSVKADACLHCGHCDRRCPFKVAQSARIEEICKYFQTRSRQ